MHRTLDVHIFIVYVHISNIRAFDSRCPFIGGAPPCLPGARCQGNMNEYPFFWYRTAMLLRRLWGEVPREKHVQSNERNSRCQPPQRTFASPGLLSTGRISFDCAHLDEDFSPGLRVARRGKNERSGRQCVWCAEEGMGFAASRTPPREDRGTNCPSLCPPAGGFFVSRRFWAAPEQPLRASRSSSSLARRHFS